MRTSFCKTSAPEHLRLNGDTGALPCQKADLHKGVFKSLCRLEEADFMRGLEPNGHNFAYTHAALFFYPRGFAIRDFFQSKNVL